MNLENCELLTHFEFGSTYQGTSDSQSDKDICNIVYQPLQDTIFRNSEKSGSKHKNEQRYYSLERFITIVLKGSFDSALLFSALLNDNKLTSQYLITSIFHSNDYLTKRKVFDTYIKANIKSYAYSLIGNMNTVNKSNKTGKDYVKFETFKEHLSKVINLLENDLTTEINYKDFCKVDLGSKLSYKRKDYVYFDMESEIDLDSVRKLLGQNKDNIKKYQKEWYNLEYDIKEQVANYLSSKQQGII